MEATASAAGVGSAGDQVDFAVHHRRPEAVAGFRHGCFRPPAIILGIERLVLIERTFPRFTPEHVNPSVQGLGGDAAPLRR